MLKAHFHLETDTVEYDATDGRQKADEDQPNVPFQLIRNGSELGETYAEGRMGSLV